MVKKLLRNLSTPNRSETFSTGARPKFVIKRVCIGNIGPLRGKEAACPASLFTHSHALKTFIRDEVVTRFRLAQDLYPG